MTRQIHVIPKSADNGWGVKKSGNTRASKVFERKSDAMDWARGIAKQKGLELVPHGQDGRIQNPNSYGNDPCPPKDRRH